MTDEFDEVRLAGLLAAIHEALIGGTVMWETPEGEVPDALEAAEASAIRIDMEGDNVQVYSGDELLGTWTKAEYTEVLRRFGRFAKGAEGEN